MGLKVPEGFRSEMAMAGDWQTVSQRSLDDVPATESLSKGIKRQRREDDEDEEPDKEAAGGPPMRRKWGAATKTYPGVEDSDLENLLAAPISVKDKSKPSDEGADMDKDRVIKKEAGPGLKQEANNPGDYSTAPGRDAGDDAPPAMKDVKEEAVSTPVNKPLDPIAEQVSMPVFKKRRPKAS
jgi:hypothetical protein